MHQLWRSAEECKLINNHQIALVPLNYLNSLSMEHIVIKLPSNLRRLRAQLNELCNFTMPLSTFSLSAFTLRSPIPQRKMINCIYLTFSLNLLTFYLWATLLCMANFHYGKVSDRMLWIYIYVIMNVQLCDSECSFIWRVFTLIPHLCMFLSVF